MEHNEHKGNSLKESILSKIRTGEVPMRSRFYFVAKLAALAVVSALVLVVSVFILDFVAFSIRLNSQDAFLSFGPRGIVAFLIFFPWPFFIADAALIAVLVILLRQFKFGYKSPLLYLLFALVMVVIAAGVAIDRASDLNDRLLHRADQHRLPEPLGDFFVGMRHMPPPGSGVCKCSIVGIEGNTLTVHDLHQAGSSTMKVILPPNDDRATTSMLSVGDTIFIAGDTNPDGSIQAFGVHRLEVDPDAGYEQPM